MDSFISAAALSFAIYELLAFTTPLKNKSRYNFSLAGVIVRFNTRSAVVFHLAVIAGSVTLVLFLLLIAHEQIGPFDAISRNRVNITLGLLWGPVFGIWVNSILRHPSAQGLTRFQVVTGIALTVLFMVGAFGKGVGWYIEKYADGLSGVKIGVAELSFANKGTGGTPGAASYVPTGARGNNVESSLGLQYVVHLHDYFIDPDLRFIKELFKVSDPELERKLDNVRRFAINYIEPPLSCLFDWPQTADDAFTLDEHLRALANVFRRLRLTQNDARLSNFGPDLTQRSNLLVSDIAASSPLSLSCADLKSSASNASWIKKADVEQLAINREYIERPYLAIALAGLMAQLNQYQTAASILSEWLRSRPAGEGEADQKAWPTPSQWFDIRARSILAAFTEEWLRKDEASVNSHLRDEHLSNLISLKRSLGELIAKAPNFEKLRRKAKLETAPTFNENCKLDGTLWRRLFVSYTSIELAYVQNTLVHSWYDERYAETSTAGIADLLEFDFSCLNDPRLFRAQVLEAYSRNAILYTRARAKKESADARKNRLKEALRAAEVGLEEVRNSKSFKEKRDPSGKYANRIAASDAVSIQEALTATKKVLEAFKEE